MVSIIRYFFIFSLVCLFACSKNEFKLKFELTPDITDNYNVNYYATDINGGKTMQAVASVREGKCELNGFTKKPTLIYITRKISDIPLLIYAEKGKDLIISGDSREPLAWKVEGNAINEALSTWRLDNIKILEINNSDSINNSIKEFVEEHPEDPVATILMLCYYNRSIDERGYDTLMGMLRGEAKNQYWLNLIGRTDQLYHQYSYPASIESMILKSINGKDTLLIDKKNPIFLILWQTGYNERKNLIDSIKKLEKEFPDSARIIADICLDADSASWRNTMRRDSLYKEMKRFWAPTGLADPTMMKLKVEALPFFIIFDKNGVQTFRGTDLGEAMKEYRNIFNSTDTL